LKKPLDPKAAFALGLAAVVVIGGIGFAMYSKISGSGENPTKQEEVQRYEKAKSYYEGFNSGPKTAGAPVGAPSGANMNNPEYAARMKSQGNSGN